MNKKLLYAITAFAVFSAVNANAATATFTNNTGADLHLLWGVNEQSTVLNEQVCGTAFSLEHGESMTVSTNCFPNVLYMKSGMAPSGPVDYDNQLTRRDIPENATNITISVTRDFLGRSTYSVMAQ